MLLKGRAKAAAQVFSSGFAVAISFFLCLTSLQYVLAMKPLGKELVYGLPVWIVQLILPLGFGLITARLLWHSASGWKGRAAALVLAGGLAVIAIWTPGSAERWMIAGLAGLGGRDDSGSARLHSAGRSGPHAVLGT